MYRYILLFCLFITGCNNHKSDIINFVPTNSIVILKTDNFYFNLNEIQESKILQEAVKTNPHLSNLQFKIKQLLSFGTAYGLFEQIDESYISFIFSGAYDIGSLFIFKTHRSLLSQILDLSERENISVYSSKYEAYRIYQFNLEKFSKNNYFEKIYLCQIGSILFMSGDRLLIEDGLKYALSETKISDHETFSKLHQINSFSDDISIFINNDEFSKIPIKHPFHPLKYNFGIGTSSWSKFNYYYSNNTIDFTGISIIPETKELPKKISNHSNSLGKAPLWWSYRCEAIQKLPSDFSYWKTVLTPKLKAKTVPSDFLTDQHQVCFEKKNKYRLYEIYAPEPLSVYFSDSTQFKKIENHIWANQSSYFVQSQNQLMVIQKNHISKDILTSLFTKKSNLIFDTPYAFEQHFFPHRNPISNITQRKISGLNYFNNLFDSFKTISTRIRIESDNTFIPSVVFTQKEENEILIHEKWQLQERVYHSQPIIKNKTVNFFAIGKGWLRYYDKNGNQIWEIQHDRFDSLTKNVGLIDWYRNGKKQLYFTRKNYFYLFPTNGRLHKKLHFSKLKSIDKLGVIYYPDRKKYRFIASSKSKIQIQDRNGKTIGGFKQKKLESPLAVAPFLISKQGKDKLVFIHKNGTLNLLNRKGEIRQNIAFEPFTQPVSAIYLKAKQILELGSEKYLYFIKPWDSLKTQKLSSKLSPIIFDDQLIYNYKNTILQYNQKQILSLKNEPNKWFGSKNQKILWIDNQLLILKDKNDNLTTKQILGNIPTNYLKASLIQNKNKVYLSLIKSDGLSLFELTL